MTELLDFDETGAMIEGDFHLHYHDVGDGPVLIMLHGSGPGVSGWSNFRGNLPVFAKSFRTILLDMPGFGLSDPVAIDRPYSLIAADSVRVLMDALGIGHGALRPRLSRARRTTGDDGTWGAVGKRLLA